MLSIAAITEVGVTVHFIETRVSFNKDKSVVMVGKRIGRTLYHLAITVDTPCDWTCFTTPPALDVWHQRLAHTSVKKIRKMASGQMVNGLILRENDTPANHPCPGCMYGKITRSRSKLGRTRATQVGQLVCVHSDVCGPMHVTTPRGSRYFVLFTGDFSSYRTVYFLKQKSEVADISSQITYALKPAKKSTPYEQTMEASLRDNNLENGCPTTESD